VTTYRFRQETLRITRNETGEVVYYVIEDPTSNKRHRLYEMEYETACLLDGRRTVEKVAKLASKRLALDVGVEDVERYIQQLLALGFVEKIG
jgi:hypothetical protein